MAHRHAHASCPPPSAALVPETDSLMGIRTSIPALAVLGDTIYMVYTSNTGSELYCSSSTDGLSWTESTNISGQRTSVPALAALNGELVMVYSSNTGSDMYVSKSTDGTTWTQAQPIDGQRTSIPALTTVVGIDNDDNDVEILIMTYTSNTGSELYYSQSYDGLTWTNTQQIIDQRTSVPALTRLGKFKSGVNVAAMVYSSNTGSELYSSRSSGPKWTDWTSARQIDGQRSSIPALAFLPQSGVGDFHGYMVMVYSSNTGSEMYSSLSTDGGDSWFSTQQISGQRTSVPAIVYLPAIDILVMVYTSNTGSETYATRASLVPDGDSVKLKWEDAKQI